MQDWNDIMPKVEKIINETFEDGTAVHFTTFGKTADNDSYFIRIARHSLFMDQKSLKKPLLEAIEEYERVSERIKIQPQQ